MIRCMGLVVSAVALVSCGGGGGAPSPELVMQGIVLAAKSNDRVKLVTFLASPERMATYLDCPPDANELARFALPADEALAKDMAELATLEVVGLDRSALTERALAIGDTVNGCKTKAPFTMTKARILLKGPSGQEESDTMRFVRLDGTYYLARL